MVKKLLLKSITFWALILTSAVGWGQCPTAVGVTASPGTTICAGESVTFTANPSGGSGYQYQWQINQSNVSGETSSTFTTTSITNGQKVRVIVTSTSEGNDGCKTTSNEVPVTVNPIRTVTATIAANNLNICPGTAVNFTISSQSNIGSSSKYEWRVNGNSQGSANSFSSSNLVAGDKVQLWVDSSVPCTEPILSNIITISEKPGPPLTPGNISGETSVCPGVSGQVYEVASVTNATSYEWQLPGGWSGTSTTNSITVTSGNAGNATLKVRAKNECGDSDFQTLDVTVQDAVPPQPGAISGSTSVCPGVTAEYSISAVARATEYVWTLPDGTEQITTAPTITVTTNSSGSNSNISVQAKNSCGVSIKRNLSVSLKPGKPATPAAITGSLAVCPGISQIYNVPAVTGATSYVWSLPTGWTGSSTSRSITVTTGTAGGNISVIAKNNCAESNAQILAVMVNPGTPAVPDFVSPLTDVCPSETNTFTVNSVDGASGYIWTLPSGWSGTSTTNTISITSASSGTGSISVQATNGCGTSAKKTIEVAIKPPKPIMTVAIEGPSNVCASTSGVTFTIPEVQYATEYVWSVPSGWSITTGQGSRTVIVRSGSGNGSVSVIAKNSCGESVAATKSITVTSGVPAQPGNITSSLGNNQNICPPLSGITFSVPAVTGATGYNWQLPAGWEITSGANTRSITVNVTATAPYQNENVSVKATNVCGQSSQASTFSNITVNNFIITNIGEDKTVCRARNPISIDVHAAFGGSSKLTPTFSSTGDGRFENVPTGNNNIPTNYTVTYTPGPNDINRNQIVLKLTVPPPSGGGKDKACGTGEDEMIIIFRDTPTATIAEPAAICTGKATDITITGTKNTQVTYSKGSQTGLTINIGSSGTATINTGTLTTTTDFKLTSIAYIDSPSCSNTIDSTVKVLVTENPTAEITYDGPFCESLNTAQTPYLSGTYAHTGGTYSATGDLASKINSSTGAFTPSNVAAGTYTVTYTAPASGGCEAITATTEVTITPLPTAAIVYETSPFCSSDSADKLVTLTGTNVYTGGTYSSTSGLNIDASTGVIKAASSTPGNYTVTYSLPPTSGCEIVTATTQVTVTEIPVPVISYTQSQICKEDTSTYSPAINGTGIVTGGTFSAPSGLNITPAGDINPSASNPGTYKITYTLPPANGCEEITAETEITITPIPSVEIGYTGPFCESTTGSKQVTFTNGTGAYEGGQFNVTPSGLTINATTGAITPSSSEAGEYTVTYSIPASGGCGIKTSETKVNITAVPGATLSYPDAPFCSTDVNSYAVNYSNIEGSYDTGSFSGTTGLIIDASTGAITPNGSTPGNHTITYTIPTADGCESVIVTVDIEIVRPIEITTQPFNVGKCAGETARLEVVANGIDLTFQWYKTGIAVPGATSSILEYSPVDPDDAGDYYVEISGSSPCSLITSETASLIVDQNIEVTSTPEAKELCVGNSTTFTVEASANGGAVEYQWMRDGVELEGETNGSLVLENISLEDEGEYSVFLEGPEGFTCSTITFSAGSLDVFEKPVPNAGNDITACYSEGAIAITDGATIENASSISWTSDGTGIIDRANEITGATYTPGANETGTVTLTLRAYGNSTCAFVETQKLLQIERLPVITSFSYSATEFCETDSEVKQPIIEGANVFQNGTFTVTPATGLSITADGIIDPSASEPGTYQIVYATPAGTFCDPVQSDAVTVVIGLKPIAEFSYDSSIYCKDTRDASQNINPVISLTEARGENFDSFNVVDASGTPITDSGLDFNATTGAINLSNSAAGDYIIQRTLNYMGDDEDGCIAVTDEFTITINDKPIPDFTYPETQYCSDPAATTSIDPIWETNAIKGILSYTSTVTGANLVIDSNGKINITASDEGTYTIKNTVDTEEDSCEAVSSEFTITIDKLPTALFSYAGMSDENSFCISSLGAAIGTNPDSGGTYTVSGPNALVTINPSTGQLSWPATNEVAGNYVVTYKLAAGTVCEEVSHSEIVTIDALPVGGNLNFGNVGRVFTTCENAVSGYATSLTLTGHTGNVVEWQYKTATSTTWSIYDSQSPVLSSEEIENLVNNVSTVIRAKIVNGACSSGDFSATAIVTVIPSDIKPSPVEAEPTIVCYGNDITLSSKTGYGESFGKFEGGDFTSAGIKNNGWNFTYPNGSEVNYNASANSGEPNPWHKTQPKWKFETAALNHPYSLVDRWWNPRTDGKQNEHFAITQGAFSSNMDTPPFTLTGMDEATVTFDQAFNLTTDATIRVVLYKNGVELKELYKVTGPASSGNYEGFGSGTPGINDMSFDLGTYLGEANLRVRFEYTGVRRGDVWAVDNIKVPEGPGGVLLQWFYDDNPEDEAIEQIGQDNEEVVSFTPRKIGWNDFEVKTALLLDSNGNACESLDNFERIRVFVFDTYETTVAVDTGICGSYSATLDASISGALQGNELNAAEVTIDGYRGEWKIENPENIAYTLTNQEESSELEPIYNPNVVFTSESDGEFIITWELISTAVYPDDYPEEELRGTPIQNSTCPPVTIPITPEFSDCTTLDFDGDDDVIIVNNPFTGVKAIEAWIRPELAGGTIISGPSLEISTPTGLDYNGRWYHLAVIFGGDDAGLYIDGIRKGAAPSGNGGGTRTSIGAKWTSADAKASDHFSGWIEEVRIWRNAPTLKEIRFMMNQRLKLSSTAVDAKVVTPLEGEVIPNKPITGSYYTGGGYNLDEDGDAFYDQTAADLMAYYRLISEVPDPSLGITSNTYKPVDGLTPDLSLNNVPGRLYNMETHQENTSPTPYFSGADGLWHDEKTWARPLVWDYPDSGNIEWNIARILNDVHSDVKVDMLGIDVSISGTLDMRGINPTEWETGAGGSGNPLYISHYLLLNGIIDLNGESQLLQPHGSIVDGASKGFLDRDQQGTASSYNYNYWVSPVGPEASNAAYSVKDVMLDGSTPDAPQDLDFGTTYYYADGDYTGRKKISEYWLHKFHGTANNYFEWNHIGSRGTMNAGEGFSMKGTMGSAVIGDTQNYTFRGLPNNGNITPGATSTNENYLVGNPYPSAIDAEEFIKDNLKVQGPNNVFNGTVYFWSHFANRTHYLEEYVGGYATFNLSGGVKAYANDDRIDNSNPDQPGGREPQRFIPVGQAFFINTTLDDGIKNTYNEPVSVSGGSVVFKNSQRVFNAESTSSSVFHSQEKKGKTYSSSNSINYEGRSKIWLKFNSPKGYHRQILVTADANATDGFDLGYDAPMIEDNVEDMYWFFSNYQFVIQGVPDFNLERELNMGIKVSEKGPLKISIDELMNIPADMNIFLRDSLMDITHDLRAEEYVTESEVGTFTERFKLVFQDKTVVEEPVEEPVVDAGEFEILYVNGSREILVRNPQLLDISKIYLNNMLGQQVHVYYNIPKEKEIRLPVNRFSSAVYVVKVHSENGIRTKKVIIE